MAELTLYVKRNLMQNNQNLQAFSITAYYWRFEFWIRIGMAYLKHETQTQV